MAYYKIEFLKMSGMVTILALSLIISEAYANESFYKSHARGWHWYEKKKEEKKTVNSREPKSYKQQVEDIRNDYEEKLNKAVMHPTKANVKPVIEAQEKIMAQSEKFKDTWMKVIYENPKLDYNIDHPASEVGVSIYKEEKRRKLNNKVKEVAKTHGLLFFYESQCRYCHEFAGIVKKLISEYQFEVLAISVDGGKLKEFPDSEIDNGITRKFGITKFPALIAVHKKTESVIPVSFGYNSVSEIEDRVDALYQLGVAK